MPAVLGAVQSDPTLAPRAETAIAIGYEVGLRIAASRDVRTLDTVNSGRWSGQGVAAAVGWIEGLPPRVIAEAVALAGAVAPHMGFAEFTQVGNHVKEAIPFATANGVAALRFAEVGLRAPLDLLDDARTFDGSILLDGLGQRWMIETCYFKPYGCCRWIHSSIDGLIAVMARSKLPSSQISRIRVETFAKAALVLNNQIAPKSLEAAQFSLPFCLGIVAIHGPQALIPMTNPDLLTDPEVLEVSSRVEVVLDAEMDSYFPLAVPSRIDVDYGDAPLRETIMNPLGESTNPMDWDTLYGKFHALTTSQLTSGQESDLRKALVDMQSGDIRPLLAELARPFLALGTE